MNNEEAIAILENLKTQGECFFSRRLALDLAIKALKERPQGEWLEVKEEVHYDYWTVCECSLCKHSWVLGELSIEDIKDDYKFCPNCGADMRGGRE